MIGGIIHFKFFLSAVLCKNLLFTIKGVFKEYNRDYNATHLMKGFFYAAYITTQW